MFKWRIIVSDKLAPAENMAVDEAIMNGVINNSSPPTIRFYDWIKPTASFGYNQNISKEIDLERIDKFGFDYIRRPTGGRLVLHNNEVTYAVIAPTENQLSGNVTQSYSEISKALKEGFSLMGVEVDLEKGELSVQHQRENVNPCFSSSSRYELKYNNKKIVGSAQVRRKNVILQHGSILLDSDQSRVADILPDLDDGDRERVRNFLSRKTIFINKIRNDRLSYSQAVDCLIKGVEQAWSSDEYYHVKEFEPEEKNMVNDLISTKYSTDNWNKRK